jgi:hypothetical protein
LGTALGVPVSLSIFLIKEIIMAYTQAQTRQFQAPQGQKEFFDLHTCGIGYLNRTRWVTPHSGARKFKPFLCCTLNALRGAKDDVQYTPFDVKVVNDEVKELIESLMPEVQARRKVLVAFKIGDVYPDPYERKVRDDKGRETEEMELAAQIKGRLISVNSVTVDGQRVYTRPPRSDDTAQEGQEGQQQANGDPQAAQTAAQGNPKPVAQPKYPPAAARPVVRQAAPASSQAGDAGTACEEDIGFEEEEAAAF